MAALWVVVSGGTVSAETLSYAEDQRIDEGLGLLGRPWDLDLVNVNSRLDQLLQVRPGFPPYDQQVEHAQRLPEKICLDINKQPIPCP
ncbi:MAG: hypothetical protein ACREH5_01800 [Candidatus Omnitrophota bacterium]